MTDPSYSLEEHGRVLATNIAEPNNNEWNDFADFEDALVHAGERFLTWSDKDFITQPLTVKLHINGKGFDVEHGLMLVTGINCRRAASAFLWHGRAYFPVRPDYGLLCIKTNFCEAGLNRYEWKLRSKLLDHHKSVDHLYKSIVDKEISVTGIRDLRWWNSYWQTRGIPLQRGWVPNPDNDIDRADAKPATQERLEVPPTISGGPYTTRLLSVVDKLRSKIGAASAPERWVRDSIVLECHAIQSGLSGRDVWAIASVLIPDSKRGK